MIKIIIESVLFYFNNILMHVIMLIKTIVYVVSNVVLFGWADGKSPLPLSQEIKIVLVFTSQTKKKNPFLILFLKE